ncbi:TonB-dependent receptor [Sphingobium mellinum]|uniref:TonB-dependent receptor n=1 Tax=Sphingobium mellinum TaxID=1387166 RepID=UPI0030EE3494
MLISTVLSPSRNPFWVGLMGVQSYAPRTIVSNLLPINDTKTYAASATIRWDLADNVKLTSISAYQKYKNHFLTDGDMSANTLIELRQRYKSDTVTQEFNLNADLFDRRLSSIFGAYYFHDKVFGATELSGNFGSGPAFVYFGGIANKLKTRSFALFTDQTVKVTDRFRLIGGLRYNIDKKTTLNQLTSCGTRAPILVTDQKFTSWTPKVGGQFDVTKGVMVYGTWQEGVKAGGVALGTCANAFKPETIKGYEVGLKTQFLDNKVRLNVAGYWYDYGNLQVQQTLGTAGGFAVTNAAAAKIKGVEGNLDAAITDRLRLNIAGMVQSAKYTNFINCDEAAFLGACSALDPRSQNDPTRQEQLAGNWLNRAAPWSVNVGLQYTFDVAGGQLKLRGESYWSGRLHFSEFNGRITQPPYSLQNAFLTYTPEGDKFEIRLYAKNIGNKDYFAHETYNSFPAQEQAFWGDPRTYGAELSYRF